MPKPDPSYDSDRPLGGTGLGRTDGRVGGAGHGRTDCRVCGVRRATGARPDAIAAALILVDPSSTDDTARADGSDPTFVVDRGTDLPVRGVYNVYPREIEEVLPHHAAVTEAAAVGATHVDVGREVAAEPDGRTGRPLAGAFVAPRSNQPPVPEATVS